MMHLNGLPEELAQFVDDALASGKYQSAEELVCDALHMLQEHAGRQGAHRHPDETHADTPP
jgi:Arc/MetJ-type ribon-helix-helix transcriptional regulator